uniref:Uncharacterized protein LOC111134876 isoform X2 n=1 Tax=Crassostrea virginica TaxID=6565 RepID=A0A8B8EK61_CRAVI|nr:uncharacterized protein LOC111134876 isoform X2 [Crassostrea virginica]
MTDLKMIVVFLFLFSISRAVDLGTYDVDIVKQRNILVDILEGRFLQEGCKCTEPNVCDCCKTEQGKTGCGKITYNKQTQVFSIELTTAGKTFMTTEVTAQQPQKCQDVIVQGYHAKVCVEIENLQVEETQSSGCLTVSVTVMGHSQTMKMGCFKMSVSLDKMLEFRRLFGR